MKNLGTTRSGGSYRIQEHPTRLAGRPWHSLLGSIFLLGATLLPSSCMTVPITGRRSLNVMSPTENVELGRTAFAEILAKEGEAGQPEVTTGRRVEMVRKVMADLVSVADDAGYEWEVKLIKADAVVNAFALPGGKMAVYTGILPVCEGAAGLAVVMGHEIGHVVAQHGTERMTQGMGIELALQLVNAGEYEELARGAVHYLVELPYGRSHESEADHIGLIYMARAGYDPREAVRFWSRMAELSGDAPLEWLSTHPSHDTRVGRLQELMPEALAVYRKAGGKF